MVHLQSKRAVPLGKHLTTKTYFIAYVSHVVENPFSLITIYIYYRYLIFHYRYLNIFSLITLLKIFLLKKDKGKSKLEGTVYKK